MARRSPRRAAASRLPVQRIPSQERFAWTGELAALLGKVSDAQLACKAGVNRDTVSAERRRRGIEPSHPHQTIEWTPEMIAALGTNSDRKVARALGIPRSSVRHKRECLGIAPFFPPPHEPVRRFSWEPEHLALLGKMSDPEVAERLEISAGVVAKKRWRLRIPPFRPAAPLVQWTTDMLDLLGKVPDGQVARLYSISVASVIRQRNRLGIRGFIDCGKVVPTPELVQLLRENSTEVRRRTGLCWLTIRQLRAKLGITAPEPWTLEALARLGRESDTCIGRDIGLSPSVVRKKRLDLHIRAFRPPRRWQPEEFAMLGTAPDEEIARRLGRSTDCVQRRRRKLRIPQARFPANSERPLRDRPKSSSSN
jgi:hypothetical protein